MTSAAEKVTSAEIKAALRRHFAAPAWQVFFEVGNDTGARVRRHADAVAIGIWPSTGHLIHGLEIKVSRSDFLGEMKNPEKSQPIFRHCHRWSLVCPAGLVKAGELPPTWGMLTYAGGKFRNAAPPAKLDPDPITPGFMAALVRRSGELDGSVISEAVRLARAEWQKEIEGRLNVERSRIDCEVARKGADALVIVEKLRDVLGQDLSAHNAAEFAEIIKAVRKSGIRNGYSGLKGILESLERSQKMISVALEKSGFGSTGPKGGTQ